MIELKSKNPSTTRGKVFFKSAFNVEAVNVFIMLFKTYNYSCLSCIYKENDCLIVSNKTDGYTSIMQGDIITIYEDGTFDIEFSPRPEF